MTFVSTMERPIQKGTEYEQRGTYLSDSGDSGGDIAIAINHCTAFDLYPQGSAVASQGAVNETYPITGKSVSVVTAANVGGIWIAYGLMRIR